MSASLRGVPAQTKTVAEETSAPASIPRFLLGLAIALALLAYSEVVRLRFVYDDAVQIVQNPHLRSWQFLPVYFTRDVWSHAMSHPSNYYRPLFLVWMRLNYQAFGMNPAGWHAAVLLVHLAVIALVYLLAARELKDKVTAGFAALLFALHPIHVESVAWVSGVSEPLMALLLLGSYLSYLRGREGKGDVWWAAALVLFAMSLLVKETAMVLPVLIFVREWRWPSTGGEEGKLGRAARRALPFAALAMAFFVLHIAVLGSLAPAPGNNVRTLAAVAAWPGIVSFYLQKLVWPWPLSLFYALPFVTKCGFGNFWLPVLILLGVGSAVWMAAKRSPSAGVACAWLFLPLLPVVAASVRFERGELVHDRYLYLPSIGFVMLCALGLRCLRVGRQKLFGLPAVQVAGLLVVACTLGVATAAQSVYWGDNLALYGHTANAAPKSAVAKTMLAQELFNRGQVPIAMRLYEQALSGDPDDWKVHYAFALSQMDLRNWPVAEQHLLRFAQLRPDHPAPLLLLGQVQSEEGKLAQAEASLRRAIALPPLPHGTHYRLAMVLQQEGKLVEARQEFKAELAVDPNSDARRRIEDLDREIAGSQ